ncbi:MAG: DNA primase, partial [Chloroflexota bacterium]
LMIPICDGRGRVVGFGARTLDPEGVPKYLNSPKTPVFDKSAILFGLDKARQAIRRQDQVVIVEGYMDVMQAHQAGYENVVAQMGTALTEPQLKQLRRYTDRMVLALDADAAGVQATLRGVEVARDSLEKEWEPVFNPRGLVGYEGRLGTELRVLRLPGGQDPDDVIRTDPGRWVELLDEAVPVVDFYLQLLMEDADLEDTKTKAGIVDQLLPVLEAVANPVEREDYAQKIARSLRIDERAVLSRVKGHREAGGRRYPRSDGNAVRERSDSEDRRPAEALERHCLSLLLSRPGLLGRVSRVLQAKELEPLRTGDFQRAGVRALFEAWNELVQTSSSPTMDKLRESLSPQVREELDGFTIEDDPSLADEQVLRDLILTLLRLRERRLKLFVQELRLLMLEAHEEGDSRGKQYDQAHLAQVQKLLKTQRALARSRELG